MAQRRMLSKSLIESYEFMSLPLSAQMLYVHLGLAADDDGLVGNALFVQRGTGATEEDMRALVGRRYVLEFKSGVVAIRHWHVHNYIRASRYKPTVFKTERDLLAQLGDGTYEWKSAVPDAAPVSEPTADDDPDLEPKRNRLDDEWSANGRPMDDQMPAQVRLGQDRLGQGSLGQGRENQDRESGSCSQTRAFTPPTAAEVAAFCRENDNNNEIDAEKFVDYYQSRGWMLGGVPMVDWRAVVRMWMREEARRNADKSAAKRRESSFVRDETPPSYDLNAYVAMLDARDRASTARQAAAAAGSAGSMQLAAADFWGIPADTAYCGTNETAEPQNLGAMTADERRCAGDSGLERAENYGDCGTNGVPSAADTPLRAGNTDRDGAISDDRTAYCAMRDAECMGNDGGRTRDGMRLGAEKAGTAPFAHHAREAPPTNRRILPQNSCNSPRNVLY